MKGSFLSLILLVLFSSAKAQLHFSGRYKFYSDSGETGSLTLNCGREFVLEDTMIVNKDSFLTSIVKGTWKIRKGQELTLFVDSIISNARAKGNLTEVQYNIRDGKFFLKIPNKRRYIRENKKLDKSIPNCLPGQWEDYEVYKAKQDKRYFVKILDFNCPLE